MRIYNLRDYKLSYNKKELDGEGKSIFTWDMDLFLKDQPETEDIDTNNKVISCMVKLRFELERQNPRPTRIKNIEGKVYIILKRYFESDLGKKQNEDVVRLDQGRRK